MKEGVLDFLSDDNVQRWIRIVAYNISGALVTRGMSETWKELVAGVAILVATGVWSRYSMTLKAKLKEMAKLADDKTTPVKGVILTNTGEGRELAKEIPGQVVSEGTMQAKQLAA